MCLLSGVSWRCTERTCVRRCVLSGNVYTVSSTQCRGENWGWGHFQWPFRRRLHPADEKDHSRSVDKSAGRVQSKLHDSWCPSETHGGEGHTRVEWREGFFLALDSLASIVPLVHPSARGCGEKVKEMLERAKSHPLTSCRRQRENVRKQIVMDCSSASAREITQELFSWSMNLNKCSFYFDGHSSGNFCPEQLQRWNLCSCLRKYKLLCPSMQLCLGKVYNSSA